VRGRVPARLRQDGCCSDYDERQGGNLAHSPHAAESRVLFRPARLQFALLDPQGAHVSSRSA
jgi:hypothetical protein